MRYKRTKKMSVSDITTAFLGSTLDPKDLAYMIILNTKDLLSLLIHFLYALHFGKIGIFLHRKLSVHVWMT